MLWQLEAAQGLDLEDVEKHNSKARLRQKVLAQKMFYK